MSDFAPAKSKPKLELPPASPGTWLNDGYERLLAMSSTGKRTALAGGKAPVSLPQLPAIRNWRAGTAGLPQRRRPN